MHFNCYLFATEKYDPGATPVIKVIINGSNKFWEFMFMCHDFCNKFKFSLSYYYHKRCHGYTFLQNLFKSPLIFFVCLIFNKICNTNPFVKASESIVMQVQTMLRNCCFTTLQCFFWFPWCVKSLGSKINFYWTCHH